MDSNHFVRFITLGCKVNQYETQAMRESMESQGIADWTHSGRTQETTGVDQDSVHFVVINTCTVTENADRENRYWIRRARRDHPRAKIIVTGCMVEHNRREIENLSEVDLVLSNHEKVDIAKHIGSGCATPQMQEEPLSDKARRRAYTPLSISHAQGRSRAFMKIQDGCDHACSFCKTVLVRGRSRSRELSDVIMEAERLRDAGYREIVLTGIQLGAYGDDLKLNAGLVRILEACEKIDGIDRVRLSSIEPTDVTPELTNALRELPKACPHLHIPLQSGDDEILRRMNRRYGRDFYIGLIENLRASVSDFALTLDVMTGFPGEEDHHFQSTVKTLEIVNPLKCHVFPYSRREGTRAAQYENVPVEVARGRVKELIHRDAVWGRNERLRFMGKTLPVLVEKETDRDGLLHGLTKNYLKVCFSGAQELVGQIVPVQFVDLQDDLFLGRIKEE
ncbi:MAG: tRNA (N(6)-L-threonylcarbamoyladenosine(37)-C(2))-methylthiotransferase MtaB [Candidatus Omnitrophica bacterium]|nr:tRNA (N(6)-L-threonylcarbamoyladenosine(37)-C(2))-methylthiotransferase MtaB [Candidatus Omnitrophota bacterium]